MVLRSVVCAVALLAGTAIADRAAASPASAWGPLGTWRSLFPNRRVEHAAIYDAPRDRVVVIGGGDWRSGGADAWACGLDAPRIWVPLGAAGSGPTDRIGHTAIRDPVGDCVLVYGGEGSADEVWVLPLAGDPTWSLLEMEGPSPGARSQHTAVYDAAEHRMIVFGGIGVNGLLADVWALSLADPPVWAPLAPTGTPPGPRAGHTAVYDAGMHRMVVFGGESGAGLVNEVWELSLSGTPHWSLVTPAGVAPAARKDHASLCEPAAARMLVFGGFGWSPFSGSDVYFGETWALSLEGPPTWQLVDTSAPGRASHVALYDSQRERPIALGGRATSGTSQPIVTGYGLWAFDPTSSPAWTEIGASPGAPGAGRWAHSAVLDPGRHRMVLFGGLEDGARKNDVWLLSLGGSVEWSALAIGGAPPPQAGHSAVFDAIRERMLVFGTGGGADVWELTFEGDPAWSPLQTLGTGPPPFPEGRAVYDPVRDRVLIFGTADSLQQPVGRWVLSLSGTPTWSTLEVPGGPPDDLIGHSAAYIRDGDRILVFGGMLGRSGELVNSLWELDLDDPPSWREIAPSGEWPEPRYLHACAVDDRRGRLIIHGGLGPSVADQREDLWMLSFADSPQWLRIVPGGRAPIPRSYHTAIHDSLGDRMIVSGGLSEWPGSGTFVELDDTWALAWEAAARSAPRQPGAQPLGFGRPMLRDDEDDAAQRLELGVSVDPGSPVRLELSIPHAGRARIHVHDVSGRAIRTLADGVTGAGRRTLTWDRRDGEGRPVPAGIYFVRLETAGRPQTRKLVLLP